MEEGWRAFQAREECEEWFARSSIHSFFGGRPHDTPVVFYLTAYDFNSGSGLHAIDYIMKTNNNCYSRWSVQMSGQVFAQLIYFLKMFGATSFPHSDTVKRPCWFFLEGNSTCQHWTSLNSYHKHLPLRGTTGRGAEFRWLWIHVDLPLPCKNHCKS